jgi:NADPH:quinone reductase-like Zn-dependent oxidoreductase
VFSGDNGANLQARQTILIHGAAGGIGSIAVQLANWRVAQGLVKPVISAVYPIAQFRDALERVREGHVRGKVVLRVAD